MRRWRISRNQWDEYPTENFKAIENLAHIVISVEILEFGPALSPESYIIIKATQFIKANI
jgi:hypothetical protein